MLHVGGQGKAIRADVRDFQSLFAVVHLHIDRGLICLYVSSAD